MSDPFDIPPPRKPTISEIIQDNIADLYDRDVGVKQADNEVLDAIIDDLLSDTDKADYFFEAVTMWGDSGEFVDYMLQYMRNNLDSEFTRDVTKSLRLLAQSELNSREDYIIEEYCKAESAERGYADEPIYLDDYRSKKGD